jgi:hypothetical protein
MMVEFDRPGAGSRSEDNLRANRPSQVWIVTNFRRQPSRKDVERT